MSEENPAARVVRSRSARAAGTLGYEPALDGVRALAVAAVLVFHARGSWADGGFLGVSTFFTLSGFLITTLMLQEWRSTGALSLRAFYGRRFRRLLPAAWFTLLLVVVMGALGVWNTDQMRSVRGDVPWALAELINWHFIAQGRAYGEQFTAPSPLEHFWSLAIEEQYYLVMPVLVLGVLVFASHRSRTRTDRGSTRRPVARLAPLVAVLVVIAAVSFTFNGVLAGSDWTRSYFGTGTRLGELVAGALLACVGVGRLRASGSVRRVLDVMGVLALAGSVVLWHLATVSAGWMYPWGFMLTAAASSLIVVGALQHGILTRLLALAPLVWLGRISYGVYLLHWPVFLWLTPARTGWDPWPLFALRVGVTLVAAAAMFVLLETPFRTRQWFMGRAPLRIAAPALVVILLASFMVTSDLPEPSRLATAATTTTTEPPPAPLSVLVVGDELAESWAPFSVGSVAAGMAEPLGTEEVPLEVTVASTENCGIALGGWVDLGNGTVERDTDRCGAVKDRLLAVAGLQQPDVVLIWSARRDVSNRRLQNGVPWAAPGDPALDDFLSTQVREFIDNLSGSGAAVVVGTAPHMRSTIAAPPAAEVRLPTNARARPAFVAQHQQASEDPPGTGPAENDDARIDRWNELLKTAAEERGAAWIDLASEVGAWEDGEFDPRRRADDGVGLTPLGVSELAEEVAADLSGAQPPVEQPDPTVAIAAQAPLPPAPPVTPRRTAPPGSTVDMLMAGESVAFNVGYGLDTWSAGQPLRVQSYGKFGCPIARGGQFRFLRSIETYAEDCDWAPEFTRLVNERDPEVAMLLSGVWDVVDRRLPGDDRFRHVGDPLIDRYLLVETLNAIDTLGSNGATVAVLTYPHFEPGRDQGYSGLPESETERVDRLNEILAEAVAMRPGVAMMIDFQGWLASTPGGEMDPAKREDGLHFYDEYVPTIGAWLGPQAIQIGRSGIPGPPP